MVKQKIKIGDDEHELELKNVNFICKSPSVTENIEYKGRIPISPKETIYHGERVKTLHPAFSEFWKIAFTDEDNARPEPNPDVIRTLDPAFIHLMGLLDLSLKFLDEKIPFVWIRPESYLYPKYQANLAEVLIMLDKYVEPKIF